MSSPSVCKDEHLTLTPNIKPVLNESNRTVTVSANGNNIFNCVSISCYTYYFLGLEKILKEVRKIREELKEVKGLLKQSRNSCVVSSLPNDIPVKFPLSNIANFRSLEDYWNTKEDKINDLVISYFINFLIYENNQKKMLYSGILYK